MVYEIHNPLLYMGEIQNSRSGFVLNEKWRTNREHGDYGDGGALTLDGVF
jgi:hypothetical protein